VKCTASQAWRTEQHESRAGIAVSGGIMIVLASLLTALLWAAIIGVLCWAAGTPIVVEWVAGFLVFIFSAAWLVLNALGAHAGPVL
jgi:hypothetical protein